MNSAASVSRTSVQLPHRVSVPDQQTSDSAAAAAFRICPPGSCLVAPQDDLARQLAIGNDRAGEGHGTDPDAQEQFDLQDRDFNRVFLAISLAKPPRSDISFRLWLRVTIRAIAMTCGHIADLEMSALKPTKTAARPTSECIAPPVAASRSSARACAT